MVISDNATATGNTISVEAAGTLSEDDVSTTRDFVFKRAGGTAALTVKYAFYGSAAPVDDYNSVAGSGLQLLDGTVDFASGVNEARVRIQAVDNAVADGTRRIWVQGLSGNNYTWDTSSPTKSKISYPIFDNDEPYLHIYDNTNYVENDGYQYFRVGLFDANGVATTSKVPVSFTYRTINGTATAGSDYDQVNGGVPVTIAAGDQFTSVGVYVHVNEDPLVEGSETYTVELNSASFVNAKYWNADHNTATGTILNDGDAPTVSITQPTIVKNEGGSAMLFEATLSKPDHPNYLNQLDFNVSFIVEDPALPLAAAKLNDDFTVSPAVNSQTRIGSLHFSPNSNKATITVTPLNETNLDIDKLDPDEIDEFNEQFTIRLLASGNAYISSTENTATGQINDNDPDASLSFSVPSEPAPESLSFYTGVTATVTGKTEKPVSFKYSTEEIPGGAQGSYSFDKDFYPFANELVEFSESEARAGSATATINLWATTDALYEPVETFNVRAFEILNAFYPGGEAVLPVRIASTNPKPVLTVNNVSVDESAGVAVFTITSTGGTQIASTVMAQPLPDLTGTTATLTEDYTFGAVPGVATPLKVFMPVATTSPYIVTKTVSVPIVNPLPHVHEPTETFKLRLSSPVDAVFANAVSYIEGTGTIYDDHDPPTAVEMSPIYHPAGNENLSIVDLDDFFADPDNSDSELTFSVSGPTSGSVTSVQIDPVTHVLSLTFSSLAGVESLTVRATDPIGLWIESDLQVYNVGLSNPQLEVEIADGDWEVVPSGEAVWADDNLRWSVNVTPSNIPGLSSVEWTKKHWPAETYPDSTWTSFGSEQFNEPLEANPGFGYWLVTPRIALPNGTFVLLQNPMQVPVETYEYVRWAEHDEGDGYATYARQLWLRSAKQIF